MFGESLTTSAPGEKLDRSRPTRHYDHSHQHERAAADHVGDVAWGAGAESRRPLGLAVVGGLLVSQLLTLYITPVYYVYIEALRSRFSRRRAPAPERPALAGT